MLSKPSHNISHKHNLFMSPRDCFLLFLLSLLWGSSFFFIKISIEVIPPLTLVFFRVFFAAIALHIFLLVTKRKISTNKKLWSIFFILGFLNNFIPFTLISWSETHISSSLAAILNATTPFWTVIISHLLTHDEKLKINKIIGITLGFIGVFIMIGPSAFTTMNKNTMLIVIAQIAVVTASLFYGISIVLSKKLLSPDKALQKEKIDPLIAATGQITGAAVLMFPMMLFIDKPLSFIHKIHLEAWLSVLGLAILGTSLAYALFYKLISSAGATNTSLVTFLAPVNAVFLGISILGETLKTNTVIGMIIILTSLLIVDGRLFKIKK